MFECLKVNEIELNEMKQKINIINLLFRYFMLGRQKNTILSRI